MTAYARLLTRNPDSNFDGPAEDAEFDNLYTGIADMQSQITAITVPNYDDPISWESYLGNGAASTQTEVFIVPVAMTIQQLFLMFVNGSASGTTTVQCYQTSAGIDTLIGTISLTGSGDVISVVKILTVTDFPVAAGDIISFVVTATGSQHDVTAGVNAVALLTA